MKALSIRQPWAWAILYADKRVENRDWKLWNPGLKFRGPMLIHASAGMTNREFEDALETIAMVNAAILPLPRRETLERGGIVGSAEIVGTIHSAGAPSIYDGPLTAAWRSSWFFGPWGLVLANVKPLPFIPFKGALGFFDVPDEIVREAMAA